MRILVLHKKVTATRMQTGQCEHVHYARRQKFGEVCFNSKTVLTFLEFPLQHYGK
jgi:hypothetical protein